LSLGHLDASFRLRSVAHSNRRPRLWPFVNFGASLQLGCQACPWFSVSYARYSASPGFSTVSYGSEGSFTHSRTQPGCGKCRSVCCLESSFECSHSLQPSGVRTGWLVRSLKLGCGEFRPVGWFVSSLECFHSLQPSAVRLGWSVRSSTTRLASSVPAARLRQRDLCTFEASLVVSSLSTQPSLPSLGFRPCPHSRSLTHQPPSLNSPAPSFRSLSPQPPLPPLRFRLCSPSHSLSRQQSSSTCLRLVSSLSSFTLLPSLPPLCWRQVPHCSSLPHH